MTCLLLILSGLGAVPYIRRAYYRWQERRIAAELERRVMADAARIIDACDAQIAVEKIARILDNAGAIHPVRVRTWDGRLWRIDDGAVTEIEEPTDT